ncbi:sterol desaturase family protein [Pseudenhygromyxa sp. WMMC2535]|uniref:sterol desaturase family protein n=1 Tax=Pseudenhygromyxa sp. WMMC2535 TaxID=2712867 RepID=UPI00159584D4|nr:sterol desaturase family protein [Pseudenhygromyxa sp. WMMC2535]NVB43109.1 sterol desaturase family protein [Pseudenhygromyxa sp. WMMC2535]
MAADMSLIFETLTYLVTILMRSFSKYLLVCGGAYLLVWIALPKLLRHRRLHARQPTRARLIAELQQSFIGLVSIALTTALALPVFHAGYLKVYTDVGEHGLLWLPLSLLILIVGGDTYFYWTHRAMHSRLLYRAVHKVHHRSVRPSPLAAYSFSVLESIVHAAYLPLVLLVMPVSHAVLVAMVVFYVGMEAYVHLGYEVLPRGFTRLPGARWLGTSTLHNMHHQYFRWNYGVYFTWWDRAMGTLHPDYDARLEALTSTPLILRGAPLRAAPLDEDPSAARSVSAAR